MNQPNVEVTERPAPPSVADIPQPLIDHFAAQGKVLHLSSGDPRSLAMNRPYGYEPVLFDELPADMQRVARLAFENPQRHFGELRLGDTILVVQSSERREWWREQREIARRHQEDEVESTLEAVEEEARKIERAIPGVNVRISSDRLIPPSAQVTGGAEIRKQLEMETELAQSARGKR